MKKDSYIAKGYLFKKRGYYHMRVYWYDANGKCPPKDRNTKIKVNEHKKREAEKKLKSFICEVQKELDRQRELAEQAALPLSGKNFLTELESYLDGPIKDKVRDNTYYEYKRAYEGHIKPYGGFQKATVGQITPEVLDAYRDTLLNEGLSPNSVNKILPIMRQFFAHYCNKHQLTTNPFDNFAPPRKVKFKGQQFYTADQLQTLLSATKGTEIEAAVTLAVELGLRRSEVCGLLWEDVDWERKRLHICHTAVLVGGQVSHKEATKSESSNRYLPLSTYMLDYLEKLKAEQEQYRKLCGDRYHSEGYIVCRKDGAPYRPEFIYHRFCRLLEKEGLPSIRFHDLRHSTAALLIKDRYTLYQVQQYLGHSEARTTEIYAHLCDDEVAAMSTSIGNTLHGRD